MQRYSFIFSVSLIFINVMNSCFVLQLNPQAPGTDLLNTLIRIIRKLLFWFFDLSANYIERDFISSKINLTSL